ADFAAHRIPLHPLRRPPWPYFRRRSATDGKTLVQQRCRAQVYSEARPSLDVSATVRDELPFVKRSELRQTRYLREAFVLPNARYPRKVYGKARAVLRAALYFIVSDLDNDLRFYRYRIAIIGQLQLLELGRHPGEFFVGKTLEGFAHRSESTGAVRNREVIVGKPAAP